MALLTKLAAKRTANVLTFAAASAGGDTFTNTGKEMLIIEHTNVGGSDVTLTIQTPQLVDGDLAVGERTVVIAKGTKQLLGPFPKGTYNNSTSLVTMTYSVETDIVIAIISPS